MVSCHLDRAAHMMCCVVLSINCFPELAQGPTSQRHQRLFHPTGISPRFSAHEDSHLQLEGNFLWWSLTTRQNSRKDVDELTKRAQTPEFAEAPPCSVIRPHYQKVTAASRLWNSIFATTRHRLWKDHEHGNSWRYHSSSGANAARSRSRATDTTARIRARRHLRIRANFAIPRCATLGPYP